MSPPELRPYQHAANEAICDARENGFNRVLLKLPTGTGKTVAFARLLAWPRLVAWLATLPKGRGASMLVIAHREELLTQAQAKIQRANPGLIVSIEQGDLHASRYSDVIVASIQTLAALKFRRLLRLIELHTFRLVVVDEAHHAPASTYRTALVHLGFLPPADVSDVGNVEAASRADIAKMERALTGWEAAAPRDRLLVGVTATVNRSDAIGLGCVFETIGYSYALPTAIDDGWLVPIKAWIIETTANLDAVEIRGGDFNQKQLSAAVNLESRNRLAVAAWEQYGARLSTIAFAVDVAHAHALAAAFSAAGIVAKAITGDTPKDERRQLLSLYDRGQIDVLTNCMVLTEGIDLPRTACIVHAAPTMSALVYEQKTGRGLRLYEGKTECVVIDLVDVARRHSLMASPVLYGLPPTLNPQGQRLKQMADDFETLREQHPGFDVEGAGRHTLEELRILASRFDVWSLAPLGAFGAGRAMTWVKMADDDYRLIYPWADGTEILRVTSDLLGHFELTCLLRPHDGGPVRQRTLATEIATADAAAGIAEAFVLQERRSIMKIRDKSAPWRGRPASQGQLGKLEKLRVAVRGRLTMGEASDLIDVALARRGR